GQQYGLAGTLPVDMSGTAGQVDTNRAVQITTGHAGDSRGAGTAAAGQGFTGTAFEYPQPDMVPVEDLHETDIDSLGESRVRAQSRADAFYCCVINVGRPDHGMRIAHRNSSKADVSTGHIGQCVFLGQIEAEHGD